MVKILMMLAKMATVCLLKIKIFWNKRYEDMIFAHDVTNKILSRYSNYIVDLVVWPNFINSDIYMTEVMVTSIL